MLSNFGKEENVKKDNLKIEADFEDVLKASFKRDPKKKKAKKLAKKNSPIKNRVSTFQC